METIADLIKRDIIPFYDPGGEIMRQMFAASTDPNYQEISKRLVIAKDWDDFDDMLLKVTSTGKFANIRSEPDPYVVPEEEYKNWYRSSEIIRGINLYTGHLSNKKWPLKKV